MKRIYFVRHGQAVSNQEGLVQGTDDPLTDTGRKQALRVSERSQNIDFDKIISSDFVRAKETAAYIAEANNMEVEYSPLFRENTHPSKFFNTPNTGEEFLAYLQEGLEHFTNPDWQYEDGENHTAFRERVQNALQFLEEQEAENILVVTHGHFLRRIVSLIMAGRGDDSDIWPHVVRSLKTINTGITVCTFNDQGLWQLWTWNDHAHFAE